MTYTYVLVIQLLCRIMYVQIISKLFHWPTLPFRIILQIIWRYVGKHHVVSGIYKHKKNSPKWPRQELSHLAFSRPRIFTREHLHIYPWAEAFICSIFFFFFTFNQWKLILVSTISLCAVCKIISLQAWR